MARRTQHEWFFLQRFASSRRGTQSFERRLRIESLEDRRLLATFTVGNLNDAGAGSLRQAILDANDLAGADTIAFGSVAGTIALTSGEMEITEALTVNGPGAAALTIDAGGNSRILNISAVTGDFAIHGLKLTGGRTTGENVDYYDTTFNGGAIRSLTTGNLTITNSTVSGNSTAGKYAAGGGIYGVGNITLTNNSVSGNHTTGYSAPGGGVYAYGKVTLTNSTVSGNSTTGKYAAGGGVHAYGDVILTDSSVSGNHTLGESADGGGVRGSGDVTLTNSTVSGNHTEGENGHGGGISGYGDVSLTDSTVTGNYTAGQYATGGGVDGYGKVTLAGSTVSGNYTEGEGASGGGILVNGDVTLLNSTISGNHTAGNFARGGGVYGSGNVTLRNSIVSGNYTTGDFSYGGGFYGDGNVTLFNSTVSENRTEGNAARGGGINSFGGITLTNSTLSGNHTGADDAGGGGINSFGAVTLINSTVNGNYTMGVGARGGGINGYDTTTLTNSTISGNHTAGIFAWGGGFWSTGDATLTNSALSGNYTTGYSAAGGGVFAFARVTLTNSTVDGNHTAGAGATGAGIRAASHVTLTNSTLSGNHTTGDYAWGGGCFTYGDLTLTSSTISGNHTAGIYGTGAGASLSQYSALTMFNSILAGNTAVDGGRPDLEMIGSVPPNLHYSLVGNNFGAALLIPAPLGSPDANGNLIGTPDSPINPLLGPLADNGGPTLPDGSRILTQAPLPGSPVIDAGDPAIVVDLDEFDQRGAPYLRVHNGDGIGTARIDMGAIESQPIIPPPALLGDYNLDNVVDAADYSVWRDTLEMGGLVPYSGADGSGNRSVGPEDYAIWKSHFGQTLPPPGVGSGSVAAVVPAEVVAPSVERVASNRLASDQEPSVSDVGRVRLVGTPHFALNRSVVTARQDHALLAWVATVTKSKPADESAEPYNPSTRRAGEILDDCGLGAMDAAFGILNGQWGAGRRHE